jgi:hypothetical protein
MPRGHPKGRRPGPCAHCSMVDDYRAERGRQLRDLEGHHRQNETAAESVVVFKQWLRRFEWPSQESARWAS